MRSLALACILGLWVMPGLMAQVDFATAHKDKTVTAVRIEGAIQIDGELDEPEWQLTEPATDFIQRLPRPGEPATERTEVRVLYNQEYLYLGAFCFDSVGSKSLVVTDMRRDFLTPTSDQFRVTLDTYDDDRNCFYFSTNPAGGKLDVQSAADGRAANRDWDGIWYVKVKTTDQGWQLEMAIPFKTLRFREGDDQKWGINFGRRIGRTHEDTHWAPIPPHIRAPTRVSLAGTLIGLKGLRQSRNLYVKPYVSAPVSQRIEDDVDFQPDAGVDVKYAVTSQLTFDGTLNTDFAQVEADEEQINLTRFSLFFPEKRDFFLENAGIFSWAGGDTRIRRRSDPPDLLPFFSRRIGLTEDGDIAPIYGGARLTGRAGPYTLGLLNMQTGRNEEEPATNFSVFRLRRDLLNRSTVGGIFVNKQQGGGSFNRTYGIDAVLNFHNYLDINSYLVKTDTPGLEGDDWAGNVEVSWVDDFFDMKAGYLGIGENLNPEVGFVPRTAIQKTSGQFGITPRPGDRIPWVLEFNPEVSINYITDPDFNLETRTIEGSFSISFTDTSLLTFSREQNFERLVEPFEIRDNQFLPVADYTFGESSVSYQSSTARLFFIDGRYACGGFWNGEKDSVRGTLGIQPSPHIQTSLSWDYNDVKLPTGGFKTHLATIRTDIAFTAFIFLNALIQYNSDRKQFNTNVRFNFIHRPLSDFFLVYNERRSTDGEIIDRALIAKLTWLFSF